jgi:hypothetical protein
MRRLNRGPLWLFLLTLSIRRGVGDSAHAECFTTPLLGVSLNARESSGLNSGMRGIFGLDGEAAT